MGRLPTWRRQTCWMCDMRYKLRLSICSCTIRFPYRRYGGSGERLILCAGHYVQKCRGAIAKSWHASDSTQSSKARKPHSQSSLITESLLYHGRAAKHEHMVPGRSSRTQSTLITTEADYTRQSARPNPSAKMHQAKSEAALAFIRNSLAETFRSTFRFTFFTPRRIMQVRN